MYVFGLDLAKRFCYQKNRTPTKRVAHEAAIQKTTISMYYNFHSTLDLTFNILIFQIGGNRDIL